MAGLVKIDLIDWSLTDENGDEQSGHGGALFIDPDKIVIDDAIAELERVAHIKGWTITHATEPVQSPD